MYKIKSIRHDEIQNNQYRFGNNYPSYVITQKNQAIAYILKWGLMFMQLYYGCNWWWVDGRKYYR